MNVRAYAAGKNGSRLISSSGSCAYMSGTEDGGPEGSVKRRRRAQDMSPNVILPGSSLATPCES